MITIVRDDMNFMSKYVASRKEGLHNIKLTAQVPHNPTMRNRLGADFKPLLKRKFKEIWALNDLNLFHNFFDPKPAEEIEDDQRNQAVHNRKQAGLHHIEFDVKNIVTVIPKDMVIVADEEGQYRADHTAHMARTQNEVDRMFWIFCRNHVGSFAKKDSTPVLVGALMSVMEDLFQIFETDAKRIILYYKNRKAFIDVIDSALQAYRTRKEIEARKAQPTVEEFEWEIPDTRIYNEDTHTRVKATMHAMQPFFALNRESNPEQQFRLFLEQNDDSIDWWYKNGDSGRENFSIVYKNYEDKYAPFYVDYIVRMKDGTVFLFDTKTKGSDPEGKNKHNALVGYMKEEGDKRQLNLMGGILIGENKFENWKYSPTLVENITDTTGWDTFTPQSYSKL